MSNKRRPWLLLARLCVMAGCTTALIAADTNPSSTPRPASAAQGASARPVKMSSTGLSLPDLLRMRWNLLLEEWLRTLAPPQPEVNGTNGLSDDPDPVGNTEDGDDEDGGRDGSKQGWKSQSAEKPPDPFGSEPPHSQINLNLPLP